MSSNQEVIDFLVAWSYDGNLQTFESRERFRKGAAELIQRLRGAGETSSPHHCATCVCPEIGVDSKPAETTDEPQIVSWTDAKTGATGELCTVCGTESPAAPIPMILQCPMCSVFHIDAPNEAKGWTNPPHRSHECQFCGCVWRPADVPTTGVAKIETRGKVDTWPRKLDVTQVKAKCSGEEGASRDAGSFTVSRPPQ